MSETNAPVAVFAYNRADKLENCIKHLEKCKEAANSELFIFCDGAKGDKDREAVTTVHEYADNYATGNTKRFKNVTVSAQESNRGLAASIISGVTETVNKYGKVIVVEDDLVVLPSFLKFMNESLRHYQDEKKCGSICSFSYPVRSLKGYDKDVYFTRKADCWGWGTWTDRWNNAEWADTDFGSYLNNRKLRWQFEGLEAGLDRLMYLQYKGEIDSWAVRWVYYLFQKGQLSLYPSKSRIINDGFDGSGAHISDGFGKGFNSAYTEGETNAEFEWIRCELNSKLEKENARFPRRFLPLYILETARFMLKTK